MLVLGEYSISESVQVVEGRRIYVALQRGAGLVGKLIQWQSRSPYSHAALAFLEPDRSKPTIVEAREFAGTRMDEEIKICRDTLVEWFEVTVTPDQWKQIFWFSVEQVGKGYDYTMVARFISRRQESRRTTGKWFCSELVFAAFQKGGINLLDRTEPWEVSPGMLARSPFLKPVSRIPQIPISAS